MSDFVGRTGRPIDHDPMQCAPACFQSHGVPGPVDPPYTGYALVLAEAARQKPSEWTFKHEVRFLEITEHMTPGGAESSLQCVIDEFPDQWPLIERELPYLIAANDGLGQPALYRVATYVCSPINFRYLYHACLVLGHLRRLQHSYGSTHIVEIGGGYGGLAFYAQSLAPIFELSIASYTSVDLPEACAVQDKYATWLGFPLRVVDGMTETARALLPPDRLPRYLISAYGFAEFAQPVQEHYANNLIAYCEHGFVVWNYAPVWPHRPANPPYKFTAKPVHVEAERPPDIGGSFHYFIWF